MPVQLTVISLDFEDYEAPSVKTFTKDEIYIGRSEENDLPLKSNAISDIHAKLTIEQNGSKPRIFITDLGSTNGTNLGTTRISANTKIEVPDNERIIITDYLLKPVILEDMAEVITEELDSEIISNAPRNDSTDQEETDFQTVVEEENTLEQGATELNEVVAQTLEVTEVPKVTINGKVGDCNEYNFTATKLSKIHGTVTHKGLPLEGVIINAGELGSISTDESGHFSFLNVQEGTDFSISAEKERFTFEGKNTNGSIQLEDEEISFEATQLFAVSGRIEHNGKALAGLVIDGGSLGEAITDESGVYLFADIPEGTEFVITPRADGFLLEKAD